MSDLWKKTATETVALLKAGAVSPAELLDILHARIAAVDGAVNALPTLCRERAEAAAGRADRNNVLAGLPVAIKDLAPVKGVRTTFGSPIFADNVPDHSDYVVERLEARGGVVYAKSNTPEFGAGANTFNPVFGVTRNPWDTRMSAAGSWAAPPSRSPREPPGWPTAPTWAAACARRPASMRSSACGPAPAWCRAGRTC